MNFRNFCLFFFLLTAALAQNSAVSSYLDYDEYLNGGEILVRTIRAPISSKTTYYCTFQFNAGQEGGGYAGIQDSPDNGQTFYYIFSLWDPSNHQQIKAKYVGPGTKVENFGGEGTGLKSWNGQLGWTIGQWYTLVLRRYDENGHTLYGYWVMDVRTSKWTHLVTMDYPVPNVYFNGGVSSFLEDWTDSGQNVRRFEIKDGFKRTKDGNWYSMNPLRYSINQGDIQPGKRSYNYRNAYDAGVSNGAIYYQTGGNTKPTCSPGSRFSISTQSQPQNPTISFTISQASTSGISWQVPDSTTPQFKYTIKANGYILVTGIDSEKRSISYYFRSGTQVEVILEDILGRTRSQKATVN